ncbi:hypothetical protein Micant_00004 [Erwinia phage Micant]|uniref:Uncharacterized protein n=1 Tax=Erwinia phage Micant TaxID=2923255 RepID=A0AAE9JV86_9CAUD|nr:hypothetical protein Micant_00004 [Erwinia phage Micant]
MEGVLIKLKEYPALYAGRIQEGYKFVLYLISSDDEAQGQRYFKSQGAASRFVRETGVRV